MKKKIIAAVMVAAMTVGMCSSAFAAGTKTKTVYELADEIVLTSEETDDNIIANPVAAEDGVEQIIFEYTFNTTQTYAAWAALATFFDSTDDRLGLVDVVLWPGFNMNTTENGGLDRNYWGQIITGGSANDGVADGKLYADDTAEFVNGEDHTVKLTISATGASAVIDGVDVTLTPASKCDLFEDTPDGADAEAFFNTDNITAKFFEYMTETADKFTIGYPTTANTSSWWGQMEGTIKEFKVSVVVPDTDPTETGDAFTMIPVALLAVAALAVIATKKRTVVE